MPKYGYWREVTQHYWYETVADSKEQAAAIFDKNEGDCRDSQETVNNTEVELIDGEGK